MAMNKTDKLSLFGSEMWLAMLLVGLVVASCSPSRTHAGAIEENERFVVTPDSVIEGQWVAVALDDDHLVTNCPDAASSQWHAVWQGPHGPSYTSSQRLVNAVFNMSMGEIGRHLMGGTLRDDDTLLEAQECYPILLSLGMTAPQQSMAALRAMVHGGTIDAPRQWPARQGHLMWAAAAWEVYCATGDRKWLREAHDVLLATLTREEGVTLDEHRAMQCGYGPFADAVAPPPSWAGAPEMMEMHTLAANALLLRAYAVVEAMGDELNLANDFDERANRLRDAVNHALWHEGLGCYAAWTTGQLHAKMAPFTDNLAQALAVLNSMADDDRAEKLVGQTPLPPYGISLRYPLVEADTSLTRAAMPMTSAFWALAAARTGNTHAVRLCIATMLRTQAFAASCGAWSDAYTGRLTTGRMALCNAAGNVGVVLRVLCGVNLLADGIELSPCVPAVFPGDKTLSNFPYRQATLDITVKGVGDEVAEVTVDGQPIEGNFVKASTLAQGHHVIEVTLAGDGDGGLVTTASSPWRVLPSVPAAVWGDSTLCLPRRAAGMGYRLVVNSDPLYYLNDTLTVFRDTTALREYSVIALNKYGPSDCSSSWLMVPPSRIVPVDSIMADESGALRVIVTLATPGEYAMTLMSGSPDVLPRDVLLLAAANTHPQGSFLVPCNGLRSNTLRLRLTRGKNTILLVPVGDKLPSNSALNTRIIKL